MFFDDAINPVESVLEFSLRFALLIVTSLWLSACGAAQISYATISTLTPESHIQKNRESETAIQHTEVSNSGISTIVPLTVLTSTPFPPQPSESPSPTLYQPTPSPSPLSPVCHETKGRIVKESLETDFLRYPLEFRVYLPACYTIDTDHQYPVLYLFHGQGFQNDQWDRIGADESADLLISSGEIPPIIIVMPYEHSGGQPSESQFGQAVVNELVPFIDLNYRTIAAREYRAVGGLSRGGGWAIYFGLRYYVFFGAIGGHSPAVFFSDAEEMRSLLDSIPSRIVPRIYLDIGERDRPEILRAALWFEKVLDERSINHEWHFFSGYHNEDYWRDHMAQYLRWYAQTW